MQTTDRRDIVGLAKETGEGVQVTAERVQGLIEKFGTGRVVAERDHVIYNHTLTAEGADMVRELAVAAEALAQAGVIPKAPMLVFRDDPAYLPTTPEDELGGFGPRRDHKISYVCAMVHPEIDSGAVNDMSRTKKYIGWMDGEWVPFCEIQLPGDTEPTRFCEDCIGWLDQLAPHLLAASAAEVARHKLVTELPEAYSADEVSAMSDDQAISTAVSCGLLEG